MVHGSRRQRLPTDRRKPSQYVGEWAIRGGVQESKAVPGLMLCSPSLSKKTSSANEVGRAVSRRTYVRVGGPPNRKKQAMINSGTMTEAGGPGENPITPPTAGLCGDQPCLNGSRRLATVLRKRFSPVRRRCYLPCTIQAPGTLMNPSFLADLGFFLAP